MIIFETVLLALDNSELLVRMMRWPRRHCCCCCCWFFCCCCCCCWCARALPVSLSCTQEASDTELSNDLCVNLMQLIILTWQLTVFWSCSILCIALVQMLLNQIIHYCYLLVKVSRWPKWYHSILLLKAKTFTTGAEYVGEFCQLEIVSKTRPIIRSKSWLNSTVFLPSVAKHHCLTNANLPHYSSQHSLKSLLNNNKKKIQIWFTST